MHNIVIRIIFTISLLIKGITVTDFMSCVKWCGSRTASIYVYTRMKTPTRFPFGFTVTS